jgi:Uma2 family endonuclease
MTLLETGVRSAMATTTKTRRRTPARPKPSRSPVPPETPTTIGELLKRLGNIPAGRVRLHPTPGTATEKDVIRILDHEDRLCELVEGTLVEKPMGFEESNIAGRIITALNNHARPRKLGIVTGEAGTIKLFEGLVRIPDVAFTSWERLPGRKRPKAAVPLLAPNLAVEVLSKGNTRAEMRRKLGEYFGAGVRLVWLVDHRKRTVSVHTSVEQSVVLRAGQSLDGGDLLPGFTLSLDELFAEDEP